MAVKSERGMNNVSNSNTPGGNIPEKNTTQWKKNEKLINSDPVLRQARDTAEGIAKSAKHYKSTHGGKGSARRWGNEQAYKDNWDRIFGGDRSNVNHRDEDES